jgi:hypothetical protein
MAHSRRLKPSEVFSAEREASAAGGEAAKQVKRLKSEIDWRRFSLCWRTRMSWYERVIINKQITLAALAREAGTSNNVVGQEIDKIDRSIRCSQGMPWRRPETISADDLELIRAGFDKRLARFQDVQS